MQSSKHGDVLYMDEIEVCPKTRMLLNQLLPEPCKMIVDCWSCLFSCSSLRQAINGEITMEGVRLLTDVRIQAASVSAASAHAAVFLRSPATAQHPSMAVICGTHGLMVSTTRQLQDVAGTPEQGILLTFSWPYFEFDEFTHRVHKTTFWQS